MDELQERQLCGPPGPQSDSAEEATAYIRLEVYPLAPGFLRAFRDGERKRDVLYKFFNAYSTSEAVGNGLRVTVREQVMQYRA